MEVQFTADQRAFIRQAIESGRLHREEDAVKEALIFVGGTRTHAHRDPRRRR
jgi:hypothetical protein